MLIPGTVCGFAGHGDRIDGELEVNIFRDDPDPEAIVNRALDDFDMVVGASPYGDELVPDHAVGPRRRRREPRAPSWVRAPRSSEPPQLAG